ncbi:MAG: nuclear transport factor 2 family protein, partial [Thermoleophilaceae bacterium]
RRNGADSPNVHALKEAFEVLREDGLEAGIERLLSKAHADFVFRPYLAGEAVLHGVHEVRAFFREQHAAGTSLTLRATSFEERGDEVVVKGSIRLVRPGGGFSESQLSWTYRFRDGLLQEAFWAPRDTA